MALFPKIDQPCPLGIDERKRIDGYCGRCSKAVHKLDAMNDAERVSFMRAASGPVCVSYQMPVGRRMTVGFGAALALSIAAPAFATELPLIADAAARSTHPDEAAQFTSAAPAASMADQDGQKLESVTITGGVSDPRDAQWIDDSDIPDLPMIRDEIDALR